MNNEQEKLWREEGCKLFWKRISESSSSEDEYVRRCRASGFEEGYVTARKKAQEEHEKLPNNCRICSEGWGVDLSGMVDEIVKRDAEIERLNTYCRGSDEIIKSKEAEIEKLKNQNETYRTMSMTIVQLEYEIEKRDKLLSLAHGNISEQSPMSYEQEIEWLKDYEEMKK